MQNKNHFESHFVQIAIVGFGALHIALQRIDSRVFFLLIAFVSCVAYSAHSLTRSVFFAIVIVTVIVFGSHNL